MDEIKKIPLDEIVRDWRVKDYIQRRARKLAIKEIKKYRNYQSHIRSCHAWLLTLHYAAITRLQGKYNLSKPEFIVLLAAYLMMRLHNNSFRARELAGFLSWMHNKIYRHLKKLSNKGYITIKKNPYSGIQYYTITWEGRKPIEAFSQHYWQIFRRAWEEWGDLPDSGEYGFY